MVDSNLHRERISYSEKAFAYKLKNDVLKRKSGRKKSQVDHKTPSKRAIEIISEDCGDSPKQVQRYISPVSYTHLDVYKRQSQKFAAGSY